MAAVQVMPYVILLILGFIEGSAVTVGVGLSSPVLGLNVWLVVVILVIADILSDFAYYYLGRTGSRFVHSPRAKYFGITPRRLAKLDAFYRDHGTVTLVFAKFSDILAAPGIIVAGIVLMPLRTFTLISVFCSIVKTPILYFGGVLITTGLLKIEAPLFMTILSGVGLLGLGAVLIVFFYLKINRHTPRES